MSNNYRNNQILNFNKRNSDISTKKKLAKTSLSNNSKIISSKINKFIANCFSKTTKNSPRTTNLSKMSKSFNIKKYSNYSKQNSKTNLKIDNSLDSTGGLKKLKFKTKNINLNIKTINMNLELKKFPYENNTDNCINENDLSFIKYTNLKDKNKFYSLQNQIYGMLNNKKDYTASNETCWKSPLKCYNNNSLNISKNNSRINNNLYRLNKSKERLSPIKIK